MKKIVLATMLAAFGTASVADVMINGKYKGKISEDSSTGNYTYNGDLDLTLKGKAGDTVFTSTFENIGKSGTTEVKVKQTYIESPIADIIDFKGGTYKSKNGKGLLQENSTKNRMKFSTDLGAFNASVMQVSGESKQEYTVSTNVGPATVMVQNVADDKRFVTVQGEFAGASLLFETQEASAGKRNMGVQAGVKVGDLAVNGVVIKVEDNTGMTQTDGIIGDISDANNGSTITGVVASTTTDLGKITGKYITKNDKNTIIGKLNVDNWEFGATKEEDKDVAVDASITVKF